VLAASVGFSPSVLAHIEEEPYVIYKPDNPPWGSREAEGGFVTTIVKTAFDRAGVPYREVFVPWKRGQRQVANTNNGFLAPITRLQDREKRYQWVAPVNISQLQLVTLSPLLAKAKWRDVRHIPVVARMASPAQFLLEDLAFEDITVVENEQQAVRMILANRALIWMQRGLPGTFAYHSTGRNVADLKQIHSWDTPLQYLIASHGVSDQVVDALRATLTSMRNEGELDRIKRSYLPFSVSCELLFTCRSKAGPSETEPVEASPSEAPPRRQQP
jgi:polar amino acid transport system substrate-binding protein